MKKGLIILLTVFVFVACKSSDDKGNETGVEQSISDSTKYTDIQWQDSVVNFGTITEGEKALVKFRFKNIGTQPLFLVSVRAGCGCTVADYTKGAIAPGASGEVSGEFNSTGLPGAVNKKLFVTANTKQQTYNLEFTGVVKTK